MLCIILSIIVPATTPPGRQSPTEWFPLPLTGGSEPDSPAPMVTCPRSPGSGSVTGQSPGLITGGNSSLRPGANRVRSSPVPWSPLL